MKKYIGYIVCGFATILMSACTADSDVVNRPPSIETGDFNTTSRTTAELKGRVTANGAHIESVGVMYADDPDMLVNAKQVEADVAPEDASHEFSVRIDGLSAGHSYFYRTYVNSGNTNYYGEYKMFTTPSMSAPTFDVFTISENAVQANAVEVRAKITDLGVESNSGLSLTNPSFKYKAISGDANIGSISYSESDKDWQTVVAEYNDKTNELSTTITRLESATTYVICAYATTAGYATSNMVKITTKETTVPEVSEVRVFEDNTGLYLSLSASVTKEGTSSITERGFVYSSTSEFPVREGSPFIEADALFTAKLPKLQNSTTYYIRAYAINESGCGYGEVTAYTTPDVVILPSVYTVSVKDIKSDRATLLGYLDTQGVAVSAAGFEFGGQQKPVADAAIGGSYELTVTGLSPKTTYTFSTYCVAEDGKVIRGETMSFTTKDAPADDDVIYPDIQ